MKLIINTSDNYLIFSSCNSQVYSMKRSEPKISFGKADKEKHKKTGMFPSTMSKQPSKVKIEHPIF